MLVITGAAGFIGSCIVSKLNREGREDLVLVDDFSFEDKNLNFAHLTYAEKVERSVFFEWLKEREDDVEFIIHVGARTDTTEFDKSIFDELNVAYSKDIWNWCAAKQKGLIYASSAATYGMGELGYDDNHEVPYQLKPLNPYGDSKNDFDKWALQQEAQPSFWAGLKFFNVYGPNEFHKGRMASVIWHTFNQIKKTGEMNLFRSHNSEYKDGEQLRDFVYVKDVAEVIWFLYNHKKDSGLYNLGTGTCRTFYDLAANTFRALDLEPNIGFVDTPIDIRDKYQYFTEANMSKLLSIGYDRPFCTLEEGIEDYVKSHLISTTYY
jgi:ADP-L-glycero-D-manno-heptose 6-epimerase